MGLKGTEYKVSYRNVKYPRLEFKTGELLLILPYGEDPEVILEKHKNWVLKKTKFIKECFRFPSNKEIVKRTDKDFRELVHSLVEIISKELGLKVSPVRKLRRPLLDKSQSNGVALLNDISYLTGRSIKSRSRKRGIFTPWQATGHFSNGVNNIYFRKMRTKWASCSPKRNLIINTVMKYLPEYLIEYVIFHEIAHIIEKRHNEKFWSIISKRFNNYRDLEKDLFGYWFLIHRYWK